MWMEADIDIEELEVHLYGQIHHSFINDDLASITSNIPISFVEPEEPLNPSRRYFSTNSTTSYFNWPSFNIKNNNVTSCNSQNEYVLNPLAPKLPPATPDVHRVAATAASERRRVKNRNKKSARKARRKEEMKTFREHHMSRIVLSPDIVCISDANDSDCEITEAKVPPIVLSSDDESSCDVELNVKCKDEKSEAKIIEILDTTKVDGLGDDDDDVVFVEPERKEVITIVCDEGATDSHVEGLTTHNNELLGTPESTNDFLDTSFNSNIDLDVLSSTHHLANDSDSCSQSASDADINVSKQPISEELNLDDFTSYIGSKATTNMSSVLDPIDSNLDLEKRANKENKREVMNDNSSDSSSESDFESDKLIVVEDKLDEQKKVSAERKRKSSVDLVMTETKRIVELQSSSSDEFSEVEIDGENVDCLDETIELLNVENVAMPVVKQTTQFKSKRFSDFWTEDLKKFYFDSWGQEDFSVENEQKKMSDDPGMWKILEKDRVYMKFLPRGPRCNICREYGHKAVSCPDKNELPKCVLCGRSGHFDSRCPDKLCTSCGRSSHFFTTYCSRCANSEHLFCTTCSMRGHTSYYCTDNWRRYHLTTKEGPLRYPENFDVKPNKDRWCSGCASRGHFEYNCNYYNRTHPRTDTLVYSYQDVYNTRKSRWERPPDEQTKNCSTNAAQNNPNINTIHSTNISPWYVISESNTGDPNKFSQQFPIYTNGPVIQQNLNNIFYPKGDVNVLTNNESPAIPQFSNSYRSEGVPGPKEVEKGQTRIFLRLKGINSYKLLTQEGADFLWRLNRDAGVRVKVMKHNDAKKPAKIQHVCVLQGPRELIAEVTQTIKNYCKVPQTEQFSPTLEFDGKPFDLNNLRKRLETFENPNVKWLTAIRNLHRKIAKNEKKLMRAKLSNRTTTTVKSLLKAQYIALNAMLLGKLEMYDGKHHMNVLQRFENKQSDTETLKTSYNYIFNNRGKFNIKCLLSKKSMKI